MLRHRFWSRSLQPQNFGESGSPISHFMPKTNEVRTSHTPTRKKLACYSPFQISEAPSAWANPADFVPSRWEFWKRTSPEAVQKWPTRYCFALLDTLIGIWGESRPRRREITVGEREGRVWARVSIYLWSVNVVLFTAVCGFVQ